MRDDARLDENAVHRLDALELLQALPAASAELIIADPPYSLRKDREFGAGAFFDNLADWLQWCRRWIGQCRRVLSPRANLFVYAIHHHACFLQSHMHEIGLHYRRQIIWTYENGWSKYRNGPACHYVVAPFAGSGSECVAALATGRRFIGSEINAEYVGIARARLAREQPVRQPLPQPLPRERGVPGVDQKSLPLFQKRT